MHLSKGSVPAWNDCALSDDEFHWLAEVAAITGVEDAAISELACVCHLRSIACSTGTGALLLAKVMYFD